MFTRPWPPEELDMQTVDREHWLPFQFLASLLRFRSGWFANHALQRLCAVRSSVAGVRERTVRSTRAAEAVAELGSLAPSCLTLETNALALKSL